MKYSSIAFVAVCLFMVASCTYGINPFLATSANYSLLNRHVLDISHGNASDMHLNISIPINSSVLVSSHDYSIISGPSGEYMHVFSSSPNMPFNFSAYLRVSAKSSAVTSLPRQYKIPSEYLKYLESTTQIPAGDTHISQLARDATAGHYSDFEKISALAHFVHTYMEYDLASVGKNLSIREILSQRRGVCGDYSLLFATLARSLGYPTRFVNGYAYSSLHGQWVGHAWNEVYIGDWVGVDSTWLEVGAIDATHVPVSKMHDSSYSLASVSAMVYPQTASLYWKGVEDVRGVPINNLVVDGIAIADPSSHYTVGISHPSADANSSFIAYLRYPAQDYRLLRAQLSPCTSESGEIIRFANKTAWTATETGKDAYLVWEGHVVGQIDKNTRYRCPLVFNSDILELSSLSIEIEDFSDDIQPTIAAVVHSTLPYGELQTIIIQSTTAQKTAYLLGDGALNTAEFDSSGFAKLEFYPSSPGKKIFYIWGDNSTPTRLAFEVGHSSSKRMFDFVFDDVYVEGETSQVGVRLNPDAKSESAKFLSWSWGAQSGQISFESTNSTEFKIPFTPQTYGDYLFSASALDSNLQPLYSQSGRINVLEKTRVSVSLLRYNKLNENVGIVRLMFNYSGPVQNIWVHVNGEDFPVESNHVQIELAPVSYPAKIVWSDPRGVQYEIPVFIRAPTDEDVLELAPGIVLEKQGAIIASIAGQGLAALSILLLIFFLKRRRDRFLEQ